MRNIDAMTAPDSKKSETAPPTRLRSTPAASNVKLTKEAPNVDLSKAASTLQDVAKPVLDAVTMALPHIITFYRTGWAWYQKLPLDTTKFFIGVIFCFFGGMYPTVFAAVEAAKHGGIKTATAALKDLSDEALIILDASKKDDKADYNKGGTADAKKRAGKELTVRKFRLVAKKMNPQKIDKAMASLYKVWLSVIAVLSLQFARTISLALTISDFLRKPIDHYLAPVVQLAVPDEYDKWVPVVLNWVAKGVAMSIAWYIQAIIISFTSALRGGLLMARYLLRVIHKNGWHFDIIPDKDEDTFLDEILCYVFAAAGFYFQLKMGFKTPFPLNLLLFPFDIVEYYIRWTITAVK